jgi:hypothetical protein
MTKNTIIIIVCLMFSLAHAVAYVITRDDSAYIVAQVFFGLLCLTHLHDNKD